MFRRETAHIPSARTLDEDKISLFNKWCRANGIVTCERMKIRPLSYIVHSNSRWSKDFRQETVKLLEENTGKKFLDVGLGNFLDLTPKVQAANQTKKLLSIKRNDQRNEKTTYIQNWKKNLQTTLSDKGLISKM